jgi:hypothetical protein
MPVVESEVTVHCKVIGRWYCITGQCCSSCQKLQFVAAYAAGRQQQYRMNTKGSVILLVCFAGLCLNAAGGMH